MEFSKEGLSQLIEDANYLQDEIEALKYVINDVPYEDKPGGADSILEMIAIIDFAIKEFYRPIIEDITRTSNGGKQFKLNVKEKFKLDMDDYGTVDKLLDKIIKHRAALLNLVQRIQPIEWEKKGRIEESSLSVYDLMHHMVDFERSQLKLVADRVMALQRDRSK